MKKRLIFIIFAFLFLLTGCYSLKEQKLAIQYRKQGGKNAVNYIKRKYNIDAKIISTEEDKDCEGVWGCLDAYPNGMVYVEMSDGTKRFKVFISGKGESNNGSDSYQIEQIEKDIIENFKSRVSMPFYDYAIDFKTEYIKEYYNANQTNIFYYAKNIDLYYVGDNDLESVYFEPLRYYDGTINLINFKSKEKYNEYKMIRNEYVPAYDVSKNLFKDSELCLKDGKWSFKKYNVSNFDEKVYVLPVDENINYPIVKLTDNKLGYFQEQYSEHYKLETLTDWYSIPCNLSYFYVFFPKRIINKKFMNFRFAYEYSINGIKKYVIDGDIDSLGNYYYNIAPFNECDRNTNISFAVLKSTYK